MRLILIEGLPGSGTSSTSQWLNWELTRAGRNSVWYYELAGDHPLKPDVMEEELSMEDLVVNCLDKWNEFLCSNQSNYDDVILDGSLFQKHIMSMLSQDVAFEYILRYSKKIALLIQQLDPHLAYLTHESVEEHMLSTYNARGSDFEKALVNWSTSTPISIRKSYKGLEGSLVYWRDYRTLCDQIYTESGLRKVKVNISENHWGEYKIIISNFLGITNAGSRKKYEYDSEIAGKYVMRDTEKVIEITMLSGDLFARNLLHNLETESFMIPIGNDRFAIRGHDVELQFNYSEHEHKVGLDVISSWTRVDGDHFDKIYEYDANS